MLTVKKGAPYISLYLPLQHFCIDMSGDSLSIGRNM